MGVSVSNGVSVGIGGSNVAGSSVGGSIVGNSVGVLVCVGRKVGLTVGVDVTLARAIAV